jgi:S1-C subfamily serine protease
MSDNREILRTTFLKGMVPARVRNQDAVDTYHATIGELQKRCGTEVASLFAEPVRPTKPDPDNPQMTWFTPLDGQMLDLATIDEVARRPVTSLLRRRLEQLKPALDDPEIGPTVASWLNITSTSDLLSVGGNPVLINWGYLPEDVAKSGIRREAHFTETVGRYAPELQRPPFTVEEAAAYSDRLRIKTRGAPATPAPAPAAAPASVSAPIAPPVQVAPPVVPSIWSRVRAPIIASLIAAAILAILLWPGVLIRPNNEAARASMQRQTELLNRDNEGLEERARALEQQARERVCRLPNGQLAPLTPLPGQAPPTNTTPRTDLLPPSPDRVQVTPQGGGPNAQPTSLNALLDINVVLIIGKTRTGTKLGSGFFVSNDRIVTNRHVIMGVLPDGIMVTSKSLGQALPARLLAVTAPDNVPTDPSLQDFALLSVSAPPRNFLALGPSPPKSTHVVADGYPAFLIEQDADFKALMNGNMRSAPDSVVQEGTIIQRRDGDPVKYLTHSAPLGRGNSGGPLVDLCGRVVGVNTSVINEGELATTANQAQDVSELRAFLEKNGVTPKLDQDQKQCPPALSPPGPAAQAGPVAPATPGPTPTPRTTPAPGTTPTPGPMPTPGPTASPSPAPPAPDSRK